MAATASTEMSMGVRGEHDAIIGMLLALSGGFLMSIYMIIVEKVGRESQSGTHYETQQIVLRTYPWAAVSLVLAAALIREPFPSTQDHVACFGIIGLALVPQLVGHTLLNFSIRYFNPSIVAFSSLLEPLFAGILAYFIFHEFLTVQANIWRIFDSWLSDPGSLC